MKYERKKREEKYNISRYIPHKEREGPSVYFTCTTSTSDISGITLSQSSNSDINPKSQNPTNQPTRILFIFDSSFHDYIDEMIPRVRRLPLGRRGLATPAQLPTKDCRSITPPYPRLLETLEDVRRVLPKGSKLTLAEKILYSHLRNPEESLGGGSKIRGEKYLKLRPDRVAMQVCKDLVSS